MPYHATGESRDSYITGVRPGGRYGVLHDVEKRRDNLPDNVFFFIKDGVQREERMRCNEEEARARIRLEMFEKKPPRSTGDAASSSLGGIGGGVAAQSAAMSKLERETQTRERREALLALYQHDREEWQSILNVRGLAAKRGAK